MTWLSRLLTQSPSQRLANRNHRTRQAQRRRRMATLETLEGRTLLSNVTVSFPTPSSPLTITGDTFNDNFTITENADGTVTVAPGATNIVSPGPGVVPGSTIDGSSAAFTTGSAVTSIIVTLPGTTNFDYVTLSELSKTPQTVKNVTVKATGANLNFAANNVDNSGNFVLSDTNTSPVNAVLNATVTNSTFATLSIIQTGGGPDSSAVTLANDSIPSSMAVSLGNANRDVIKLNSGNVFGMTTLLEGNGGPSNSNSLGNSDTVTVAAGSYRSLNVDQLLNGTGDIISIIGPGIVISPVNPTTSTVVDGVTIVPLGVTTLQGNGAFDFTKICGVATSTTLPNLPLPTGIGWSNVKVVQGNGSVGLVIDPNGGVNDSACVTNSTLSVPPGTGYISITQSDLASNTPMYNTAKISGDTAGGNISISQLNAGGTIINGVPTPGDQATVTGSKAGGNITITQGTGSNDFATVSTSTAGGNVSITQQDVAGNAAGDKASVLNVTAGTHTGSPSTETGGLVTITQGNAPGDVALLNGDDVNDVVITQGNNVQVPDGSTVASDVAEINDTTVTSDVTINQGTSNSAGNYVAAIGFDYLGWVSLSGTRTSSPVTVGGGTLIDQQGANNQVFLGDAESSPSFTTFFLDVFTGSGGGAYVQVSNTVVDDGALGIFSPYNINGGGDNTSSLDNISSLTVTLHFPRTVSLMRPGA